MADIFFAQIREDSRVERCLTESYHPSSIVTIGSGGCTSFSVLSDEVEVVYAIDQNPAQTAMIELKKAAIQRLSRDEFLSFIGEAEAADRIGVYKHLAIDLPHYARTYWDGHLDAIRMGINQCGATEAFYRFIGQNIRKNLYGDDVWMELFSCRSMEEQQAFADKYLMTEAWHTAVKILLSKTTHLQFFPAYMFAQASENDFGSFFSAMFARELARRPIRDNYFLSQLLFSSYRYDEPEGMPFYLSETGYALTQRNCRKLIVLPDTLQKSLPGLKGIDAFFLSNVFDWANEKEREEICSAILLAKSERSLVLFRNMLSRHPLPAAWRERLQEDKERSQGLLELERSMMYQQITTGVLA